MSKANVTILLLLVVIAAIPLAGCSGTPALAGGGTQVAPPAVAPSGGEALVRTITITGVGTASARPDLALIQLGAESIDNDAGRAISDNTERMSAVMDSIMSMGPEEEDVQTVSYSLWIEQVTDREGQPTGETRYHAVNQVRVRLRDLSKTGELVQRALEAGANNVGGVSFTVSDPAALQRAARDAAIADARSKAEQLASGLGSELGSLRQVSEYGGIAVPALPEAYGGGIGGGGGAPMSGGKFSVTVEIQVLYDIAD